MMKSLLQWLAGIATAVIIAVIIFLLTSSDSPLHKTATPSPDAGKWIRLVEFTVDPISTGQRAVLKFIFTNDGPLTLEECEINFAAKKEVSSNGGFPSPFSLSSRFSLLAGQQISKQESGDRFDSPGIYKAMAQVWCLDPFGPAPNSHVGSLIYYRDVRVSN